MTSAAAELVLAQAKAKALFCRIEECALVREGQTETEISEAIYELAARELAVERHWHRRVVRAGINTRLPYRENPPVRTVEADDIVSIDLGPVFGEHEADFGKSYVLGSDPHKLRLCSDLEVLFESCRAFYRAQPGLTGAALYAHVVSACAKKGWGFGGAHAGHLVGRFPIAAAERDAPKNRIRPDNHWPMNGLDAEGSQRHWVLEIHLLEPSGAFGGFYEDLLDL